MSKDLKPFQTEFELTFQPPEPTNCIPKRNNIIYRGTFDIAVTVRFTKSARVEPGADFTVPDDNFFQSIVIVVWHLHFTSKYKIHLYLPVASKGYELNLQRYLVT